MAIKFLLIIGICEIAEAGVQEEAITAYTAWLSQQGSDSKFHLLSQTISNKKCDGLYSWSTFPDLSTLDALTTLLVYAELADLLIFCRDATDAEAKLKLFDGWLTKAINSIGIKKDFSNLPSYLTAEAGHVSGTQVRNLHQLVKFAESVYDRFSKKKPRELSLRLKPEGFAGEIVDFFLLNMQFLSFFIEGGFCIILGAGNLEYQRTELKQLIRGSQFSRALTSEIEKTFNSAVRNRIGECQTRGIDSRETAIKISAKLDSIASTDVKPSLIALVHLKGCVRSWAQRRKMAFPWNIDKMKIKLDAFHRTLISWAAFEKEKHNYKFNPKRWTLLSSFIVRIWGGPDQCRGLQIVGGTDVLRKQNWNPYAMMLQEAFYVMFKTQGADAAVSIFAVLDRWLSNCRVTLEGPADLLLLRNWQAEADNIRDFYLKSVLLRNEHGTREEIFGKSRELELLQLRADIVSQKNKIINDWAPLRHQRLTIADNHISRVFQQWEGQRKFCTFQSSKFFDLLEQGYKDLLDKNVSPNYAFGALLWKLEQMISECKLEKKYTDAIFVEFQRMLRRVFDHAGKLLLSARELFPGAQGKWIEESEISNEPILNEIIYLGMMRRLRHFGMDFCRSLIAPAQPTKKKLRRGIQVEQLAIDRDEAAAVQPSSTLGQSTISPGDRADLSSTDVGSPSVDNENIDSLREVLVQERSEESMLDSELPDRNDDGIDRGILTTEVKELHSTTNDVEVSHTAVNMEQELSELSGQQLDMNALATFYAQDGQPLRMPPSDRRARTKKPQTGYGFNSNAMLKQTLRKRTKMSAPQNTAADGQLKNENVFPSLKSDLVELDFRKSPVVIAEGNSNSDLAAEKLTLGSDPILGEIARLTLLSSKTSDEAVGEASVLEPEAQGAHSDIATKNVEHLTVQINQEESHMSAVQAEKSTEGDGNDNSAGFPTNYFAFDQQTGIPVATAQETQDLSTVDEKYRAELKADDQKFQKAVNMDPEQTRSQNSSPLLSALSLDDGSGLYLNHAESIRTSVERFAESGESLGGGISQNQPSPSRESYTPVDSMTKLVRDGNENSAKPMPPASSVENENTRVNTETRGEHKGRAHKVIPSNYGTSKGKDSNLEASSSKIRKDVKFELLNLIEAVQRLPREVRDKRNDLLNHSSGIDDILGVIEIRIKRPDSNPTETDRDAYFNVRQALKPLKETSKQISELMTRLDNLIGDEYYKRKIAENVRMLEEKLENIKKLAALKSKFDEL